MFTSVDHSDHRDDALGRRVRKVISYTEDFDGEFHFVWSPDWQLMEVYKTIDDEPALTRAFVHAGSPSPWYSPSPFKGEGRGEGVSSLATAYIDDHIVMYKGAPGGGIGDFYRYYYHTDAQFNTLALTKSDGSVAASDILSPYGQLESITVAGGTRGLGLYATNNAFLHQGLLYDAETGMYYNRWREYLAQIGRFGQRDPKGFLRASLYEYENSTPTMLLDPDGRQPRIGVPTITEPISTTPGSWVSCEPGVPVVLPVESNCAEFAPRGMKAGGYTMCCGGVCGAWINESIPLNPGVRLCRIAHECDHCASYAENGDTCSDVPNGNFPDGIRPEPLAPGAPGGGNQQPVFPEECRSYQAQLACLRDFCVSSDSACNKEECYVKCNIDYHCNGGPPSNDCKEECNEQFK